MASVIRNLNEVVAHMPGVKREVRAELQGRAQRVESVVRAHRDTGALARNTGTITGRTDTHVFLEDPAVYAINYGHKARDGSWVEGIHAIEAAL